MAVNPPVFDAKSAAARAWNAFNKATFTIGTKQTNTINVAVQLRDPRNSPIQQKVAARVWLASAAVGHPVSGVATTSALAIGTNGVLLTIEVTGLMALVLSDASGRFDLNLVQTVGGTTYYMVVQMPDGSIVVSGAIAF